MAKRAPRVSHLMPCSVVLLTAGTKEKSDAMTATCMFISEEPPLLVVSVDKQSLTHNLIEESGEFTLNITSTEQVKLAKKLGASHGKNVDKFKTFGIATSKGVAVKAPMVMGSSAGIECKVITSFPVSTYTVFVAEAVNAKVSDKADAVAWYRDRYFRLTEEVR